MEEEGISYQWTHNELNKPLVCLYERILGVAEIYNTIPSEAEARQLDVQGWSVLQSETLSQNKIGTGKYVDT